MGQPRRHVTLVAVDTPAHTAEWVAIQQRASPCAPWGLVALTHWWEHVSQGEAVLALDERGEPVAAARVEMSDWAPESRHAVAWVIVVPAHRRTGIGTTLTAWVADWVADRRLEGADVVVNEASTDAMSFWSGREFVEVGRDERSRLELSAPPPAVAPPDGIRFAVYDGTESQERGMYDVAVEAFPDIPGPEPYSPGTFEHWRDGDLLVPGLIHDCSFVALAGDRVVGYVLLVQDEVRPDVAMHEMTAVAREWRGRGVASALKRHQLERAFAAGRRAFETENEARNGPVLALNRRLGYRPLPAEVTLRGSLAALRAAAAR